LSKAEIDGKVVLKGAEISGSITLEVNGVANSAEFHGRLEPDAPVADRSFPSMPPDPGAPTFYRALEEFDFVENLAHVISQASKKDELKLLTVALVQKNESLQMGAVAALAKLGKPAIPVLVICLESEAESASWRAAWALSRMGEVGLAPLIAASRSKEPGLRLPAVRALGWTKSPSAILVAIEALKDPEPIVRLAAVCALTDSRAEKAPAALADALRDESHKVRLLAAMGLHYLGKVAAKELIGALKNPDVEVRLEAACALGEIRDPASVPALVAALKDKNDEVRWLCMKALMVAADARAVDALVDTLGDERLDFMAMKALVHVGAPAVEALITAVKHKNEPVRKYAARALGEIGDERALPALRELAKEHPDDRDGIAAEIAVKQILARRKAI